MARTSRGQPRCLSKSYLSVRVESTEGGGRPLRVVGTFCASLHFRWLARLGLPRGCRVLAVGVWG